MQASFELLSDSQWEFIKEYLPIQRQRNYCLRDIVNAILSILRTGTKWRNLDSKYPPWESVYYYFRIWRKDGTLERLNSSLNQRERKKQGKEATPSLVCIDSQSIKAAPFISQEKGIDGNKRINGRKRHILVDTLGLVWAVVVPSADRPEGTMAHLLVEHLTGYLPRMKKILVDQAYKKVFLKWVEDPIIGLDVELSSKPPSSKGFVPVKWRILWANCQILLNRF